MFNQLDLVTLLNSIDTTFSILQKLSIIVAALVGLYWFKKRYTKGDFVIHSRLKLNIDGEISVCHGTTYLLVVCTLENVGVVGHDISRDRGGDAYFRIYWNESVPQADKVLRVRWDNERHYNVFKGLTWISSGEVVKEEFLIKIPESDALALKLQVGVVRKNEIPWKDEKIMFKELVTPSRVVGTVLQLPEDALS